MILYKITCLETGKIYIGITSKTLKRRWGQHWANARRGVRSALYAEMRNIKKDRWKIEAMQSHGTYVALLAAERTAISILGSTNPDVGYNRTAGGQGALGLRFKKTPEQIEKSARHHRGRKLPPERIELLREQLKWMAAIPRKPSQHYRRDVAIMLDYFSSASLADTGRRFGIKAAAASVSLKRCRERLSDNLAAMDVAYVGVEMPRRIHPDHLEFE